MTMTSIEQVRWLAEIRIDDSALVGQKAATLAMAGRIPDSQWHCLDDRGARPRVDGGRTG
jgi:hypothetical protein